MNSMTTSWENRKQFFKNTNFDNFLAVHEGMRKFEIAKSKYCFDGLSDSDLEMYMFQMALLEYEELKAAQASEKVSTLEEGEIRLTDGEGIIDKLLLRDYAHAYYENLLSRVELLIHQAPSSNSLQTNQQLFKMRNEIAADNKAIVTEVFRSYLADATLTNQGYEIINGLTGERHLLPRSSQLSLVLDRSRDMFTFTDRMPGGMHPEPIFNYDSSYWREYSISVCQSYIDIDNELRLKFGSVEKDSEYAEYDSIAGVASFKKCLAEYRDYAEGYKFNQEFSSYQMMGTQEKKPGY